MQAYLLSIFADKGITFSSLEYVSYWVVYMDDLLNALTKPLPSSQRCTFCQYLWFMQIIN